MTTILLLIMIGCCTFYIALPYFKKDKMPQGIISDKNNKYVDLCARYTNLLSTIKELEFDHKIGKLSFEDFTEMNTRYRHRAATILEQIDKLKINNPKQKNVNKPKMTQDEKIINDISFCSACGSAIGKHFQFCANCGKKLS